MGIEVLWNQPEGGAAPEAEALADQFPPTESAQELVERGLLAPLADSRAMTAALLADAAALALKLRRLRDALPGWIEAADTAASNLDRRVEEMDRALAYGPAGCMVWDEPDDDVPAPYYRNMAEAERRDLRGIAYHLAGQLRPLLAVARELTEG